MMLINQIPNKSLFKMQEVCEICQIKPYVLRFWDSEFDQIQSIINSAGKKLYQKKDIVVISLLKDLLFDRKLTIEKARTELSAVDFDAMIKSQMEDATNKIQNKADEIKVNEPEKALALETILPSIPNNFEIANRKIFEETAEQLKLVLDKIEGLKSFYNWA